MANMQTSAAGIAIAGFTVSVRSFSDRSGRKALGGASTATTNSVMDIIFWAAAGTTISNLNGVAIICAAVGMAAANVANPTSRSGRNACLETANASATTEAPMIATRINVSTRSLVQKVFDPHVLVDLHPKGDDAQLLMRNR